MSNTKAEEKPVNSNWVFLYNESTELRQTSIEQQQLCSSEGLVIGRKQEKPHLTINHPSISKEHCRLFLDNNNQLHIIDLNSTNGIFVNNKRLKKRQPHLLKPHEKLRLAELPLTLVFPSSPKPVTNDEESSLNNEKTLVIDEEKTFLGNLIHHPLHDSNKNRVAKQGKHIDHHSVFIEKIMTFGARKPLISFLLILLITVISTYGLLSLKLDTSYESMLNKKDPNIPIYNQVIKNFGSDNLVLIYYEGEDLFTADKLKVVNDVSHALQNLEVVEKVESLATALHIRYDKNGLETGRLIKNLPKNNEEARKIKSNALYNPIIVDNLLSKDGKKAAIIVSLRSNLKKTQFDRHVYELIEHAIQPLHQNFSHVFQMGNPRITVEFEKGIFSDLIYITPLAVLVLVMSIVLMLRTFMAALLPLMTSFLSIIWAFGFLGFCGIPVNLLTTILPALIIVIGSTEDTHMLAAYLQGLDNKNKHPRFPAIRFMAVHVGLPIFITSFTTAIGFFSNSLSDITLIKHFGISSAFGMLANLFATILVLPLLLQLFGPNQSKIKHHISTKKYWMGGFVDFVEQASENHQKKIMMTTAVILIVFGFFALQVTTSNDPLSFFKSDNEIVNNSNTLHKNLAGMQTFFVTVHARSGTDFKNPAELKKLEAIQGFMNQQGIYDKILSINDYLKLLNREFHHGDPNFYRVPETQALVQQYLILLHGRGISRVINHDNQIANFIVRHNVSDSATLKIYLDELSINIPKILKEGNQFSLTGKNLMINQAAESLFVTQITSVALLIVIIFVLMSVLYSSVTAGFVSLVANIIPVIIMFGTMGILGIPLNPATAIVSVIAIGIAIDDTIHILSTYNKECRVDGDQIAAARRAVRVEAIPIIATSLSLAAGFLILTASSFNIIAQFGLLSALTMIFAMMSDLLITPVLFKRVRLVSLWDVIALNIGKQVLTESEIFAGMTPFQIKRVILLSQTREYQAGEIVIQQGDVGKNLFIVIAGESEIIWEKEGEAKMLLARLGWGEIFGEVAYATNITRTATVKVPEDGQPLQVILLNQEQVKSAMRFYPRLHAKLNYNICKILAQRLAQRTRMGFY